MTSDLWNILKWRDVSNWYCSPLTLLKTLIIDSIFKNSYVFKLTNASAKQVFILKCTQINSSIYTVNLKTGTSLFTYFSVFKHISEFRVLTTYCFWKHAEILFTFSLFGSVKRKVLMVGVPHQRLAELLTSQYCKLLYM